MDPFLDELAHARCPLLLFYGEKDVSIPESDRHKIQSVLNDSHIPHSLILFTEADHGFFCDERKVYDKKAAEKAWELSIDFLQRESATY